MALLINPEPDGLVEAEVTLSRSWAGPSVASLLAKLQALRTTMGEDDAMPPSTRIFFSPFCLYHPADGAAGSLAMDAQLDAVLAAFIDKLGRSAAVFEMDV